MITALILAAGSQARWEKENPFGYRFKQLLPVGDESIIARIVRQCNERGVKPLVISHHVEIAAEGGYIGLEAVWHIPIYHRWTVETLLMSPWDTRTIVLLGDVVYSKTVMDRIFGCTDDIRVFGSIYEIFAVSFCGVGTDVQRALLRAIRHAEDGGPGKLRKFYQAFCGLDMDSDQMEDVVLDRVCYIQDYTMDVDTPRDYKELLNKVVKGGLLDDC